MRFSFTARFILVILALFVFAFSAEWLLWRAAGEADSKGLFWAFGVLPISFVVAMLWLLARKLEEKDDIWDSLGERGLQQLRSGSTKVRPPFLIGGVRVRGELLGPLTLTADNEGIIFMTLGKARSKLNWSAINAFEIHSKESGGCFARVIFADVGLRGTKEIEILWNEKLTALVPGEIRRRVRPGA